MKKVLLVATVQSHICQFHRPLVSILHQYGYLVHVAAKNNLQEKNGLKLDFVDKVFNVSFSRNPLSMLNFKAYKDLKRIIKENGYKIVHSNTPMGGVLARLAAIRFRKTGTKVVYTAHGFHFYKGSNTINWITYFPIELILSLFTDKIIVINSEDYELGKVLFPSKTSRIHGVGVDTSRYYPRVEDQQKLKQNIGYCKDSFILLCSGELNMNKNQKAIINALNEIILQVPNVKLLIAGNGPQKEALMNLARKNGISNYVDFIGYRTDLEKYVIASDLIISCSKREGLGLNIIEALLCGKPVVASMNRGHAEIIQDGVNGIIVKKDDSSEYAAAISALYLDKFLYKRLSDAAHLSVVDYASENVIQELEDIYRNLEGLKL